MSTIKEQINRSIFFDLLPRVLYRTGFDRESKARIQMVRDQLQQFPGYSFIAYFNHISYNDPYLTAFVTQQIDPHHTRHWIAPVSYSNSDPDNPRNKRFIQMVETAKALGIETYRVIQSHQIHDPNFSYTKEFIEEVNSEFSNRIKELNKLGAPIGLLISPEGHRSETGKLLDEVHRGILAIGMWSAPLVYVPVGISYKSEYDRNSFNLGRHARVSIGEPVFQKEPRKLPSMEQLMGNLAYALPEAMRGIWK